MARKYTPAQIRSKLRQAEQKQRQAINKYNQEVRRYNQKVKAAVNSYNQAARSHNARVRANRQRIRSELARLDSQARAASAQLSAGYRSSVVSLHKSYFRLESFADQRELGPQYGRLLDLSEREVANGLAVTNRMVGAGADVEEGPSEPESDSNIIDGLRAISPDLCDRWTGAVYSLSPNNPDAARHFCTSAREIIASILELKAPDADVFALLPDCEKTQRGNATRRSRLRYFLRRRGMLDEELEEFVESDMANIVELFHVFNDGTHGSAGRFGLEQLRAIRTRVEQGILFLSEIIGE